MINKTLISMKLHRERHSIALWPLNMLADFGAVQQQETKL